jgi:hypothetical protein
MDELRQQVAELNGALNRMAQINEANEQRLANLNARVNQQQQDNAFKIPDPIKSLPTFDGNRKQLASWLRTAETTLGYFQNQPENVQRLYLQAVINKAEGKARDILCLSDTIESFDRMRELLTETLGDRQELSTYQCQLWKTKMTEETTIHKYHSLMRETIQKIKILAKQKPIYNANWEAINQFIDEFGLAAFVSGLKKPYFGYAQASKPKDVEDAYAFLCKFTSNERNFEQIKSNRQTDTKTFTKKAVAKNPNPSSSKSVREEPMDIDPSLRSRRSETRMVHNHEVYENDEDHVHELNNEEAYEETEKAEEDETEFNVNFWEAIQQTKIP